MPIRNHRNHHEFHAHNSLKEMQSQTKHLSDLSDLRIHLNNSVQGDGSNFLKCSVFAHDSTAGHGKSLVCDTNHQLKVVDSDVLTKLGEIKTSVEVGQMDGNNTRSMGDGSTLPVAVCIGYDNDNGKMRSVDVDADGRLNNNVVSSLFDDGSGNCKVNVVNTIFAGISGYENIGSSALTRIKVNSDGNITTDNITTIYGAADNLFDNTSCVAAGTFSSVVNWGDGVSPKSVQISLLATASVSATGFEVYGSHDGTDYARLQLPNGAFSGTLGNTNIASGSMNTSGGLVMDWAGHRYLKVKIYCLGTFNGTATGLR